jgi:hypothetical protein
MGGGHLLRILAVMILPLAQDEHVKALGHQTLDGGIQLGNERTFIVLDRDPAQRCAAFAVARAPLPPAVSDAPPLSEHCHTDASRTCAHEVRPVSGRSDSTVVQ